MKDTFEKAKVENNPELTVAQAIYSKNKSHLFNIKRCKSLSKLIEWVKRLPDDFKAVRKQSKVNADLEKVYEDNEWVVYVPHSHAAAKQVGKGTNWSIAFDDDYYYNIYSAQGPLYINIRKSDNAKFQFHFETGQFMNSNKGPIQLNKIGLSEGAVDFYAKIDSTFNFRLKFDWMGDFKEGFAAVKLNGKCNFINTEGKLLSRQWFDWMEAIEDGFAEVSLNGKWNFINTEGQILSHQWFDAAWGFREGFAEVNLNGKYNFINTEGRLLSQQWFDYVGFFNEGFAEVNLNGRCNFINAKGQFLSEQWFTWVGDFKDGFADVKINGKRIYINTEGQLLSTR